MATFVERNGRWQAKVCVRPFKPTAKTFATLLEAKTWSDETEASLKATRKQSPKETVQLVTTLPRGITPVDQILDLPRIGIPHGAVGIYFLFRKDQCIYVGQSRQIHTRVHAHIYAKRHYKIFDSYTWITCRVEHLDELERHYIRALKPIFNTTFTERNSEVAKRRAASRLAR